MANCLIDLHNDVITCLSAKRFLKYIAQAERLGVKAVFVSVWTSNMERPMQRIQEIRQFLDGIESSVRLLLHIEDAWFVNEGNLDELIAMRPFSVGLTWNANNNLAGGALSDGHLTEAGKAAVEKLAAAGVLIDLAHLNRSSFFEVVQLSKPFFCSHACFGEVCRNPRNLDRDQIQAIVDSGGVVGLTLVGDFLRAVGRAGFVDVYRHIKYFIDNFGDDFLCIGTDFYGTKKLPRGLRSFRGFKRFRKFLLRKGLSEACISKIFYVNSYKVL